MRIAYIVCTVVFQLVQIALLVWIIAFLPISIRSLVLAGSATFCLMSSSVALKKRLDSWQELDLLLIRANKF